MIDINAKFGDAFCDLGNLIGRGGENISRRIVFDCADILEEYPSADIYCVLERSFDHEQYTVVPEIDGTNRVLVLTNYDLTPGQLLIELRAKQGEAIRKSVVFSGRVVKGIQGEPDVPGQPIRDVLDRVENELTEAEKTRDELVTALDGVDTAVESANTAATNATEAAKSANTAADNANLATDNAITATNNANAATAETKAAIADARDATDKANTAANYANDKAQATGEAIIQATKATENANAAATRAENAADSAESATEKAVTATEDAETAASNANSATKSATTATDKANTAASNADAATAKAEESATKATTAAGLANEATAKADIATGNAETATAEANKATSAATTAAETANTAASNADTKAGLASTAAENAQNAADRANASASSADTATQNAQTATANAETATKNANTATQNAQNATADAKTATNEANTAADSATTAAGKANTAADAANSAAAGANTATVNANKATTNADSAAANANAKATAAETAAGKADTAAANADAKATLADTAATNAQTVADDIQAKADSGAFNGKVQDVQLNGKSILTDGVATIPVYTERVPNTVCGIYEVRSNDGTTGVSLINGALGINPAGTSRIKERSGNMAIATTGYDYAVKCAMTDGVGAAWTLDEQKAARQRMGLDGEYKLIEKIELTEPTTLISRSAKPDGTAYNLRRVFIQTYAKLESGSGKIALRIPLRNGSLVSCAFCNNFANSTFSTQMLELWIENGMIRTVSAGNVSTTNNLLTSTGVNLITTDDAFPYAGDTFTVLPISQLNGLLMSAGTTFWIYGVDA